MKLNLKLTFILLTVFVIFGFTACVEQNVRVIGTEAELTGLTIGDTTIDVVQSLVIPSAAWESENFDLYGQPFGAIAFNREGDIKQARIRPRTSTGALAEWGIGTRPTAPGEFADTRVPATFESDEYIYIKVTSEDREIINYYRFYTTVFSWVTDLNSIKVVNPDDPDIIREAKAEAGGSSFDEATESLISLTTREATDTIIESTTFDENATVEYAKVTGNGEPQFQSKDVPITFNNQDFLYVKVTAQNTIDTRIFKFRVDVGRMATIKNMFFDDAEIYGKGLPTDDWATTGPGDYDTVGADQPAGGFELKLIFDDPDARAEYQIISTEGAAPPAFGSSSGNLTFGNKDILAIKVFAKNDNVIRFYKLRVTLLPAKFLKQPQSAWYFADYVDEADLPEGVTKKAVEPLTVEMDRPGNYTYKWYGADSWFGIYGRHGSNLDEKNNVSCVNGGPSMYFYLVDVPEPGREFGGDVQGQNEPWVWEVGDGQSFIPRNDWKNVPVQVGGSTGGGGSNQGAGTQTPVKPVEPEVNFLEGSTNETRYYWCVVTDEDSGLVAVSDRAVFITESDPKMDHFVFELTKLPRRKNLAPFTYLRELDTIDIPSGFFPDGFDPSKYQICIAIARYYLPDGRPWTQNWTHGDLHFGYTPGSSSFIANSGELTWWHNNMGANSGSIPLQAPHSSRGGLGFPPDWIGFAPSGDDTRVPLMPQNDPATGELPRGKVDDKAPVVGGTAQGWFCGFIELLEIRFQTAPVKDED